MANNLDDWVVKVGWDGSAVDKGFRDLDKKFNKFSKTTKSRLEKTMSTGVGGGRVSSSTGASTRLRPITFEGRQGFENRIARLREQASLAASRLQGRTDPSSQTVMNQANAAIQNLNNIQNKLASTTYKNSDAYKDLYAELGKTGRSITTISRESRTLNKQFTAMEFAANGFSSSLKNFARSYLSVFAVISGGAMAYQVAKDFERINAVMLLSSKSSEEAAMNMEYIDNLAQRLGGDISATADAFAGFNVSAVSAGLTLDQSKETFTQLATAIQATGLDAHRSGLAFLAFKQMLAGPVIQAQEMNQVVEQMPQFTGLAIKALREMGYAGENYRNIVASGTVNSQRFVSIVARLANEQAVQSGAAEKAQNSLIAAQNRMMNTIKKLASEIFKAGLDKALKAIFDGFTVVANVVGYTAMAFSRGLGVMVDAINWLLTPLDMLLDSMGFEVGGLGFILGSLAAFFAGGMFLKMLAGFKALVAQIRALGLASAFLQAITLGPAGIAKIIAGVAAVGATAYAFDKITDSAPNSYGSSGSQGYTTRTSNVSSTTNNINQTVNVKTNADAFDIARASRNAMTQEMSK